MTEVCTQKGLLPFDAHFMPDTGDVFWEPKIVNAFQNADLEFSKPTPNLDACFERDTVSVDELLDHLMDVPLDDRTRRVSQQLLASIGEPGLFKWCKSVPLLSTYSKFPPDSVMYNKATIRHGIDHVITRALANKQVP